MAFIDFNDEKQPIGKRKQSYVRWAVSKGTSPIQAKKQANAKFGFAKKEGIFGIVIDYGRLDQRTWGGTSEVFQSFDLRKYKQHKWCVENDKAKHLNIRKKYESMGWDVFVFPAVG